MDDVVEDGDVGNVSGGDGSPGEQAGTIIASSAAMIVRNRMGTGTAW